MICMKCGERFNPKTKQAVLCDPCKGIEQMFRAGKKPKKKRKFDKPVEKKKKLNFNKPIKRKKKKSNHNFYSTPEWRKIRYEVLRKYGAICMCCGARPPDKVIHVDHIKPRSKRPDLELKFNNLQVLCEDCNLGKSNTDSIDYRPKEGRLCLK